jgi:hypothetical protein
MIRVPRPRIVSVRRSHPKRVSIGDVAEARLDPGLMAILEGPIGVGYHPRYNLPVSLAATAAVAVLTPTASDGSSWAGRDLEVEWFGTPGIDDSVVAQARLEEFSERLARFSIQGRTVTGQALYSGSLRMLARRDGVPAGFRSGSDYEAVRARLSQIRLSQVSPGKILQVISAPQSIPLGRSASLELQVLNTADRSLTFAITGTPPFGAGLSFESTPVQNLALGPGESARVLFSIRADRPHEVNLGRPWELEISVKSENGDETLRIPVHVPDPNPGRTFYILTEDCETFDGGPLTGNYGPGTAECGNRNNFMDPEDYRIQMILKPDLINRIAERHGAKWTHFYTATQCFAAQWAAEQSSTGEWPKIVAEMQESVRAGSKIHEYSPHIHFDYEPDSPLPPQPRLVYDPATDGILPNDYYHPETNPTHCYHDWDGSARAGISYIKPLGDWTDGSTKAGSMRKSLLYLARLQANRRTPLVARTGSYDFGKAPADQAISTNAYLANGLLGNSDVYRHGAPPTPGGQLFWCAEEDRHRQITDLRDVRLLQFGIPIETTFQSADEMNQWFAAHWPSAGGPGVHAILFTTHAMYFRGVPDMFRSLEGGSFDEFDRHLAWVRENYPEVEFATATEALLEYLDYYTPALSAYTEPLLCGGDPSSGRYEFAVQLLGRGIRVDQEHPARVRIAAPPCFCPGELVAMRVTCNGQAIAVQEAFDVRWQPAVELTLTSRDSLRLEVQVRPEAVPSTLALFREREEIVFHEPQERSEPDLFLARPPVDEGERLRFSSDIMRLLMNPIAGHTEPLGRRIHPMGGFTLGIALTAAFRAAGEQSVSPARLKLRWLREVDLQSSYLAETNGATVRIRDDNGAVVAEAEVTVNKTEREPAPKPNQEREQEQLMLAARAWERDFTGALELYRGQRAWKLMLAARKAYSLLIRGNWRQRAAFLLGRSSSLQEYDLEFPKPAAYLPRNPDDDTRTR